MAMCEDLRDVETDGDVYDKQRDPPGQRSVYILPGDAEKETYRMSTFIKFPPTVPMDPCALARNGFMYTGYKDRVKCFSCGICMENWAMGDDPASTRWHYSTCLHAQGRDTRNVPIPGIKLRCAIQADRIHEPMTSSAADRITASFSAVKDMSKITNNIGSMRIVSSSATRNQAAVNQQATSPSHPPPSANIYVPRQTSSYHQDIPFAKILDIDHRHMLNTLDLCKEEDRRRSFSQCSRSLFAVTFDDLARSGFFYLGNLDRVQCFSCYGVLKKWQAVNSVDVEHRKHFSFCKMIMGTEQKNQALPVPSSNNVTSSNRTASMRAPVEPTDPQPSERQQLAATFPCQHPVNGHMSDYKRRLATFDSRWPAHRVRATPEHIASAGFFFLGENDRAKCWYCNGGLQNWDLDDEPWTEHAKWFPGCEFVLQRKGVAFVQGMVSKFPNLRRPAIRNPHPALTPTAQLPTPTSGGSVLNGSLTPPRGNSPAAKEETRDDMFANAIDMGFDEAAIWRAIEHKKRQTDGQNFSNFADLIDALLASEQTADNNTGNFGGAHSERPTQLVNSAAVISSSQEVIPSPTASVGSNSAVSEVVMLKRKDSAPSSCGGSNEAAPCKIMKPDDNSIQDELTSLEAQRLCKQCHLAVADHVVIPCGHLSLCDTCSLTAKRCVVCRRKVQTVIKTFLS